MVLDSPFEIKLYERFLEGSGAQLDLSFYEFQDIVAQSQYVGTPSKVTFSDGSTGLSQPVSLYGSPTYNFGIGGAKVFIQNGNTVGFADEYDFENKSWFGSDRRSLEAESATRAFNAASGTDTKKFSICYGKVSGGVGC